MIVPLAVIVGNEVTSEIRRQVSGKEVCLPGSPLGILNVIAVPGVPLAEVIQSRKEPMPAFVVVVTVQS